MNADNDGLFDVDSISDKEDENKVDDISIKEAQISIEKQEQNNINDNNDNNVNGEDVFGCFFDVLGLIICIIACIWATFDKRVYAYSDNSRNDISVECTTNTELARITIVDDYVLAGETYYIFKTNVSGNEKFTLSESDYIKYIGEGNNAVECTIYKLSLVSDVYSYKYNLFSDMDLYSNSDIAEILSENENISFVMTDETYAFPYIKNAYNYKFEDMDSFTYAICKSDDYTKSVISKMELYQYSFVGDDGFSNNEINEYVEIMHNTNIGVAKKCIELIK